VPPPGPFPGSLARRDRNGDSSVDGCSTAGTVSEGPRTTSSGACDNASGWQRGFSNRAIGKADNRLGRSASASASRKGSDASGCRGGSESRGIGNPPPGSGPSRAIEAAASPGSVRGSRSPPPATCSSCGNDQVASCSSDSCSSEGNPPLASVARNTRSQHAITWLRSTTFGSGSHWRTRVASLAALRCAVGPNPPTCSAKASTRIAWCRSSSSSEDRCQESSRWVSRRFAAPATLSRWEPSASTNTGMPGSPSAATLRSRISARWSGTVFNWARQCSATTCAYHGRNATANASKAAVNAKQSSSNLGRFMGIPAVHFVGRALSAFGPSTARAVEWIYDFRFMISDLPAVADCMGHYRACPGRAMFDNYIPHRPRAGGTRFDKYIPHRPRAGGTRFDNYIPHRPRAGGTRFDNYIPHRPRAHPPPAPYRWYKV